MIPISDLLIVDSDQSRAWNLQQLTARMGIRLCQFAKPDASIRELELSSPDMVLLGPALERDTYLKCIHKIKIIDTHMPILIAADPVLFTAISTNGAYDCLYALPPELTMDGLSQAIQNASADREKCRSGSNQPNPSNQPIIIGRSEAVQGIWETIKLLHKKDITTLITGESGTGKELVAQLIHCNSSRRKGAWVKVNCAALPDGLLESEIFGFQKGAFTGANKDKPGRVELAHKGTLFLDEIGDLSLLLQAKILQVLEDKEFSRLGDTVDRTADVRIVAATNQDLREMVGRGRFRKDLFYRLNVVNITVPPLRERKEDIPLLIDFFSSKYFYETNSEPFHFPDNVTKHLDSYHWPGNVRQLENMIRRIVALGNPNIVFDELHLQLAEKTTNDTICYSPPGMDQPLWNGRTLGEVFEDNDYSLKKTTKTFVLGVERGEIVKALKACNWNRVKAALMLRVSYKTLLNRMLELDLKA